MSIDGIYQSETCFYLEDIKVGDLIGLCFVWVIDGDRNMIRLA